jgi:hypothetical protein
MSRYKKSKKLKNYEKAFEAWDRLSLRGQLQVAVKWFRRIRWS